MRKLWVLCIQFILLLLATVSFEASAGELNYEILTLRLYNEQKWDSLIVVGEEAIDKGFDYYYMRVRVGTAAFEKQRYIKAIRHLEKAIQFNSFDPYPYRLLYKAYQYSSRNNEARLLLKKMPAESGITDRRPLLYIETGPAFTNHIVAYNENKQTNPGTYSEVYLNRNSQYFLAGIAQPFGRRYQVQVAAARLNFNKRRIVNINYYDPGTGTLNPIDSLSGDYNVSEWEFYLSPNVILNKHFSISPAFRLVNVTLDNPLVSEDSIVNRLIGPSGKMDYNDYAGGGEISYQNAYGSLSAGVWWIHVDKLDYTQISGTLFLTPFGNLNLYSSSTLSQKTDQSESNYTFNQMIGGRVFPKLWAEVFYTWGDLSESTEQNAQVIYNAFDVTTSRTGSKLILNISDYLKFSIRYQVFFREGTELFYPVQGPPAIFTYNYINQSITGGITWKLH